MVQAQLPSPIELLYERRGVQVYVKREDNIHPEYGGNKWRKLKYNIAKYREGEYKTLVTFGGPFSNHIAATAALAHALDIPAVGLIRGTYEDPHNPTLQRARQYGMRLLQLPKEQYRLKEASPATQQILSTIASPLLIPEGGANASGRQGCAEIMTEIENYSADQDPFDALYLPAGTGTTAAGMMAAHGVSSQVLHIVAVLRDASLQERMEEARGESQWQLLTDYHFGGFARVTSELVTFINDFKAAYGLALDPIYNGKAMYALCDRIDKGYHKEGSRLLYIHTGGHQGIRAYNYTTKREGMLLL